MYDFSLFITERRLIAMMNFHSKKSKQIIAVVIIVVLVIAMVVPTMAYMFG